MFQYVVRRVAYALPIILGVNILTFLLFFIVNPPDKMARKILGEKNVTPQLIENWKRDHNYHLPRFYNPEEVGVKKITQSIFYQKSVCLLWFDFGTSDRNNQNINKEIAVRMGPSLSIALPTFLFALAVDLTFAMILAYCLGTFIDFWGVIVCVVMMSVSSLFYIIGGQYLFGKFMNLFPISGFDSGAAGLKFILLPFAIGVIEGMGTGIRFYRTVFLEEINKDYVRTARAKGLSQERVLFQHVLKNAMIPILTQVVMTIPFLFMGSLIMESFFSIPGLGNFTLEAIQAQDFAIVRSMVFLGSMLYVIGMILTDISYTLVDPRVRLE